MLPGIMENPQYKLQRDFYNTAYGNNPRKGVISEKTLENASIATVQKYYKKLFSGTKGLKLIIVGDPQTMTRHPFYRRLYEYVEALKY